MEACDIRFAITEQASKQRIYEAADDKTATASQQKWPEVKAWMESHDEVPRLVWVLESYQIPQAANSPDDEESTDWQPPFAQEADSL
jgi:hypothetical protein